MQELKLVFKYSFKIFRNNNPNLLYLKFQMNDYKVN